MGMQIFMKKLSYVTVCFRRNTLYNGLVQEPAGMPDVVSICCQIKTIFQRDPVDLQRKAALYDGEGPRQTAFRWFLNRCKLAIGLCGKTQFPAYSPRLHTRVSAAASGSSSGEQLSKSKAAMMATVSEP